MAFTRINVLVTKSNKILIYKNPTMTYNELFSGYIMLLIPMEALIGKTKAMLSIVSPF